MVLDMNKNDIRLIVIIILIAWIILFIFSITKKKAKIDKVYYRNDLILNINLGIDKTYEVMGENGKVVIEVLDDKIRVVEENSPYHLCSKQGFISNAGQSIICLPNKIIIKLPNEDIDTEVS